MSEPQIEKGDDEYITASEAPELKPQGVWQMPSPVFRQTSGRLPQGFEKVSKPANAVPPETPSPVAAPAASPPVADIAPQPYVSEDLGGIAVEMPRPAARRSPQGAKILLILLAIVGALIVAVIFAAVVFYFVLASRPESSF